MTATFNLCEVIGSSPIGAYAHFNILTYVYIVGNGITNSSKYSM